MENSNELSIAAAMERLEAVMAPLSSGAAGHGSSATGGCNNVVAFLDAAAKKRPMEKLVATMAFCEAPLDGTFDGTTSAPSSSGAAGGGGDVVALLAAAAKKLPVKRLVSTMAFCEAPFDGTLDGTTSAPGAAGAGGSGASSGEAGGGDDDAEALRREWLAEMKKAFPLRKHPLLLRDKASGAVVDGLAIFEAVALQ